MLKTGSARAGSASLSSRPVATAAPTAAPLVRRKFRRVVPDPSVFIAAPCRRRARPPVDPGGAPPRQGQRTHARLRKCARALHDLTWQRTVAAAEHARMSGLRLCLAAALWLGGLGVG